MPLTPYFKRSLADVSQSFLLARSIDDLCKVLEIPKGNLFYIAYKIGGVDRYYRTFNVRKKSGGFRQIMAPSGSLKIIQQKLQSLLKFLDRKSPWSHGFHEGKSIATNARQHLKSAYIFNVDIENFYQSIHFGRVAGIFRNYFKFDKEAANLLAHLCCYRGALPAGSPCAPALANLASWSLDQNMLKIAKGNKLTYTRYADDLTFSAKMKRFPAAVGHYLDQSTNSGPAHAVPTLEAGISDAGFRLNGEKTRLQFRRYHQSVTGLTVNEFVNVKGRKIKEIRKLLYLWEKFGSEQSAKFLLGKDADGADFLQKVYGNLSYIKSIRGPTDEIFKKFCYDAVRISPKNPKWIKIAAEEFQVKDIFLSHASEDKVKIAEPLFNACKAEGISVFYDADAIQWGDSIIERINKGLGEAKLFVPVITPNFLEKKWPLKELNSAFSRFMNDKSRILPIIHEVGDLSGYPLMNDVLYKKWEDTVGFPEEVAKILSQRVANLKI